ncbi:MAG: response regulator [Nitrososphaera sp.]|jgi:DNA-binding response OmpR family regulator
MALARILVVDDDPDTAVVLKIALEYHGYRVDIFSDPQKALSEYEPMRYDLALIDLRMSGLSGFELYDKLAQMDEDMAVFFMTGYDYSNVAHLQCRYPHISSDHYIRKPLDVEKLIKLIKKRMQELPSRKQDFFPNSQSIEDSGYLSA